MTMAEITVLPLKEDQSEPTYLYEDPTDPDSKICLRGFFITQHGKRIHSFFSPSRDIDRLCITPQIGDKSNQKMADLFGSRNISWQRTLDTKRISLIKDWWENNRSLSTNGSIVWLPAGYRPTIDNNSSVSKIDIDPSQWTVSECDELGCGWSPSLEDQRYTDWKFDCCYQRGKCYRPGKLVDGQHRVRGMSQANIEHSKQPVISTFLCEDDSFTSQLTAKIFTEITSKAEGLESLHAEFLMAKYSIKPKYSTGTTAGRNRRIAYEVVVGLNKSGTRWGAVLGTQYKGRIKMLKPSKSKIDLIDADRMAKFVFGWIHHNTKTNGGEIKPLSSDTVDVIVEYLEYFLDAVLDVWGPGSNGTNDFWDETRGSMKAGQRRGVFRMMMHLFGIITARIKLAGSIPNMDIYKHELNHIKNVEWTNLNTWAGPYTKQDTEQAIVRNVLSHIYLHAPNPLSGPKIPPRINSWMNGTPDPFEVSVEGLSVAGGKMKIKSRSQSKIADPLYQTNSNTGSGPINATSGCTISIIYSTEVIFETTKGNHNFIVDLAELKIPQLAGGLRAVNPGDRIQVKVSYSNGWNGTPTVVTKNKTLVA